MQKFPTIKKRMIHSFDFYQDQHKAWLKSLLKNISFFKTLDFDAMEYITSKIVIEDVEEDEILFKTGDTMSKMYLLLEGEIETYLQMADNIMTLDVINEPGSSFAEASILNTKEAVNFCAKVSKQVKLIN
mgnify:CR=1 FL=1